MINQSRLTSFRESCSNTTIGFALSLACQFAFLVLIEGLPMTWHQNLRFALVMTAVSIARTYAVRRWFERKRESFSISPAIVAVLGELKRQREVLGWDAAQDDSRPAGELLRAGAAYGLHAARYRAMTDAGLNYRAKASPIEWPWIDGWNPEGERRDAVKGAALTIAGIESCDRTRSRKAAA